MILYFYCLQFLTPRCKALHCIVCMNGAMKTKLLSFFKIIFHVCLWLSSFLSLKTLGALKVLADKVLQ